MNRRSLRDHIGNDTGLYSISLILAGLCLIASPGCSSKPRTATTEAAMTTNHTMTPEVAAALSAELIERRERDQAVRSLDFQSMSQEKLKEAMKNFSTVDQDNTAWLKGVIDKWGWPPMSLIGREASIGAFLIVQHADLDPEFQSRCLPMLKEAAEKGEVRPGDVAYLEDRVRVAQKRPQLYGTQYGVRHDANGGAMKDANGNMIYLLPVVQDAAELDARREAMGLGPWFEYETMMANMQKREPSKTPTDWDGKLPIDPQRER